MPRESTEIKFFIAHNISSSKGWGRYRATTPAGKLVQSSTGNEWVSAGHAGNAEEGQVISVRLQTMERVGKRREERIDNYDYTLIAEFGANAELGHYNGLQVMVEGARIA